MWEVEFYVSANGECPTQVFIDSLHKTEEVPEVRRKIGRLRKNGHELRRPHADYLGDGIYELRIPIKRKQIRLLYFFFYQDKIVISHGIRKESKVPKAEIELAKRHKEDYFSRHMRQK